MRHIVAVLVLFAAAAADAQSQSTWDEQVFLDWTVYPNVVYRVAGGRELKLDIYSPDRPAKPVPVAVFIHGGGWVTGSKEAESLQPLPFLALGVAVIDVEYRLASAAPAPAAVEDCRCALHWIAQNASRYHIDPARIIVTGASAGGHLALMTGMLRPSDGFDRGCPAPPETRWTSVNAAEPKVAAVINWFGITDVRSLLADGSDPRAYAIEWLGNRDDAAAFAQRLSPLTYVRANLPPILTIHADDDPVVPASQATRLHDALRKAGATEQLRLLHGGGHGQFDRAQQHGAWAAVRTFLQKTGVLPPPE